jgi:hypothetical protein
MADKSYAFFALSGIQIANDVGQKPHVHCEAVSRRETSAERRLRTQTWRSEHTGPVIARCPGGMSLDGIVAT